MRVSSCLCLILFRAVDIGLGLARLGPQLHMTLGSKKLDRFIHAASSRTFLFSSVRPLITLPAAASQLHTAISTPSRSSSIIQVIVSLRKHIHLYLHSRLYCHERKLHIKTHFLLVATSVESIEHVLPAHRRRRRDAPLELV